MEGNNNHNYCNTCGSGNGRCGSCGNMCGFGRHNLLRWFLGILIIIWIFSIGVKFGEIKAYLDSSGYGNHMYYRSMPMMGGASFSAVGGAEDVVFSTATTKAMPAGTAGTIKVINAN